LNTLSKYIFFLLLICPNHSFAQFDATGMWKGTLYNDSNRLTYAYEIVLNKQGNHYTGFSHTWFLIDDKRYYGVKKVKARVSKDKILIQDDGLIEHNYPVKPDKNVRQLNILDVKDSTGVPVLFGPFTTNRTKNYAPLTGYIYLVQTTDFHSTSLLPHLTELNLIHQLPFMDSATVVSPLNVQSFTPPQERKDVIQHRVHYMSDTLHLTLFDNGEVDGDSVSVFVNGIEVLNKIRLSTTPVKLAVPTNNATKISVIMYAESLGTIPPNTGLLLVEDGKRRYELRFSSSYTNNAVIEFYRTE
jgi:hypothetical protein